MGLIALGFVMLRVFKNFCVKRRKIFHKCVFISGEKFLEKYSFNLTNGTIDSRLNGQVTTPYKGHFMFYYATNEENERYLSENKVS